MYGSFFCIYTLASFYVGALGLGEFCKFIGRKHMYSHIQDQTSEPIINGIGWKQNINIKTVWSIEKRVSHLGREETMAIMYVFVYINFALCFNQAIFLCPVENHLFVNLNANLNSC